MEGRLDLLEEKMVEVQGELQHEMGSVRSDLQRLGPLEKNMGVLLEKMLDWVEQSLQKMGEKGNLNWDRGKGISQEIQIHQPFSHTIDSSDISGLGEGLKAASASKDSTLKISRGIHLGSETLKETTTETTLGLK